MERFHFFRAVRETIMARPIRPHAKMPTILVLNAMAPKKDSSIPRDRVGLRSSRAPCQKVSRNRHSSTTSLLL